MEKMSWYRKKELFFKNDIIKKGFKHLEAETVEFMRSGRNYFCMKLMYF